MGTTVSEPIRCKKGQIIFREGDTGSSMYDIRWGSVGVYVGYGSEYEKQIATLNGGDCFGELALIDTKARSATIIVLEDGTQLIEITVDGFSDYFRNKPEKILKIMENMSNRFRILTDDYMEACRTIDEYLEKETAHEPKSASLLEKMKKFAGVFRNR